MLTWSHVRRVVPALLLGLAGLPLTATAQDVPAYGIHLENYEYPFPVEHFEIEGPGETYRMAYMDVKPEGATSGTVVLMHGKNFCGAYWKRTATDLRDAGYRSSSEPI